MRRAILTATTRALADQRQVRVIANTEDIGRDNIVLVTTGIDLANYRRNPVVLYQHDPDRPIARAITVTATGGTLEALIQFPDEGASGCADETFELIRSKVISAVSTGFETLAAEPIDPRDPSAGTRITKSELHEISFVSIPALPSALVSERSLRSATEVQDRRRFLERLAQIEGTKRSPVQPAEPIDPRIALRKMRYAARAARGGP